MARAPSGQTHVLIAQPDQPLIGVIDSRGGEVSVRYFTGDGTDATSDAESIQRALDLAGAWNDLDWAGAERELDQIRHESVPTPPVELDA